MEERSREMGAGASTAGNAGAGDGPETGAGYGQDQDPGYGQGYGQGGAASTEMQNLIADVEDLLRGVAGVGDADVARLRARVQSTLESAKVSLGQQTEQLRAQAADAAAMADDYVHAQPWAAVGIAAGVGLLVGLLMGRGRA